VVPGAGRLTLGGYTMTSRERWLESALIGLMMWVAAVVLAYIFAPGRVSGALLWPATLLAMLTRYNIGTEGEPFYEATPITWLAFLVGVLLGFPIYTVMTYVLWSRVERATARRSRLMKCLAKMKGFVVGR
jgi:glycerol uptake facilitator-like aquaporin